MNISWCVVAVTMAVCSPSYAAEYPTYIGAPDDLKYLRSYVETFLGQEPGFFDEATIENTDLLRDFVHQANYTLIAEGRPDAECLHDIGCMFRERVGENCGFMTLSLLAVFEAFGFDSRGYDTIDGTLSGPLKYRDSHVFSEVWIPSLGQYVLQDPTFNLGIENCETKERMSFDQTQATILNGESICFAQKKLHERASDRGTLTPKHFASLMDDYYGAVRLAMTTFDGPNWSRISWFDLGTPPPRPAPSVEAFEKTVADCANVDDLPACVDATYGVHAIRTTDFDGATGGLLLQFTIADGSVRTFDPVTRKDWPFGYSQILYAYVFGSWDAPGDYIRYVKPNSIRLSGGEEIEFPKSKMVEPTEVSAGN